MLTQFAAGDTAITSKLRYARNLYEISEALLHYLLPERRDNDTIRSPRNSQPFSSFRVRTNKFQKSFLLYCLKNFI